MLPKPTKNVIKVGHMTRSTCFVKVWAKCISWMLTNTYLFKKCHLVANWNLKFLASNLEFIEYQIGQFLEQIFRRFWKEKKINEINEKRIHKSKHTGAKILNLSKNSHFKISFFDKIRIFRGSFFTKLFNILKFSFFTKFTFLSASSCCSRF